jgi:uncharacterized protein YdeI (YjbR/CyaY-like superfamily)
MTRDAEIYFTDGCGRCSLGGTPDCKVHRWQKELAALRRILLSCGLTEECKWGVPCYTFQQNNVILLGAFKDYCFISFLKGALMQDTEGILSKPGENTQAERVVRFTEVKEVVVKEAVLKSYVFEALEIEKAGLKVQYKSTDDFEIPEELQTKLASNPAFKTAFEALTPGRKRGYLLHFSAPKQAKTREARIDKYTPQILAGKGLHD